MKNTSAPLSKLFIHQNIVKNYQHSRQHPPSISNIIRKKSVTFLDEQIFQQLQKTAIVQDYFINKDLKYIENQEMDIEQKDQMDIQPYQNIMPASPQKNHPPRPNFLDSASSDRQFPQRNSSISSIESGVDLLKEVKLGSKMSGKLDAQPIKLQTDNGKILSKRRQVGSSTEKRQRLNKIKKIQQIGCNCKKSKCLKMYCECFNLQILCGQNCCCEGCQNMNQNHHHQKAVLDALTRNPRAFVEDSQKITDTFNLGVDLAEVRKGCKCKKTKCKKKYCQCYNSGQICGIFCTCEGCENCHKQ